MSNIKYNDKDCNNIRDQKSYEDSVKKQDITHLTCDNCKKRCFCENPRAIFYGHYKHRIFIVENNELKIIYVWIQRIKCLGCGETHTIAPDCHLYYYPFLLKDAIDLFKNDSKLNYFLNGSLMRAITRLINNHTAIQPNTS